MTRNVRLHTGAAIGLILGIATSFVGTRLASAENDRLPPDLAKAAAAYDQAQVHGDRGVLDRLVAEDYVLVNGGGHVEGKCELILGYTAPGATLKPYVVTDRTEKVFGDSAVLAGAVVLEGTSDGKPFTARLRFADVWRRSQGRWQVVFTEVTRSPPP